MLSKQNIKDIYPLSPMQAGMFFHWLYNPSSPAYFEQMSYRLHGKLDKALVEKSLNELLKLYDVLRTVFIQKSADRLVQVVLRDRPAEFYYEDIKNRDDKEDFLIRYQEKNRARGFDLGKDVLMRAAVFRLKTDEYEFTWSFHHILMDGWCTTILVTEFYRIYSGLLENRPYRGGRVEPYRTYIDWLERQDRQVSKQYWSDYLAGYQETAALPGAGTRMHKGEENDYYGQTFLFALDGERTRRLSQLAGRNSVTVNTIVQSLWGILLGKYNRREDVVFGAVVSGRPPEIPGVESMVGLFINTIPVRIRFHQSIPFNQLLTYLQRQAVESEPHHYHPLAEVQSLTPLKQDLINHILVFENFPIAEKIDGLMNDEEKMGRAVDWKISNVGTFEQTNYDLNLVIVMREQLSIRFDYNANAIEKDRIEEISRQFTLLVEQILDNDVQRIQQLELLSESGRIKILEEFNTPGDHYLEGDGKTLHRLFQEQSARTPDSTGLVGSRKYAAAGVGMPPADEKHKADGTMHLTYRELNQKSDQAAYVLKEKGVQVDSIVGIMLERSVGMIIAILGILKAGGAYLPIDPQYPQERIDFMLKDSNARVLVTTPKLQVKVKAEVERNFRQPPGLPLQLIHIETDFKSVFEPSALTLTCQVSSANLAYIIYTSGTTGEPKGMLIQHRNVVCLLFHDQFQFDFSENDIWTMFHSYCFDFSVWEMYGALLYGGKLVVIPKMVTREPAAYLEILKKEKVTVVNQTPSAFYNLIDEELKNLRKSLCIKYIIFGGETLSPGRLKEWKEKYPRTMLINMYGITETTVHVTYKEIMDNDISLNINNIGSPIPTLSTYVMDKNLKLLPPGIPGELCVAGKGLGRGYLNRVELTTEKFVELEARIEAGEAIYHSSSRSYTSYIIYKSGDLVKLLYNDEMEYLGRIDHQVKIRGFRVELGEIENCLADHEDIVEAVVILREALGSETGGEKNLIAYIVARRTFQLSELRSFLAKKLPDYMIPAYFVPLKEFPLTENGKIHRKALPDPRGTRIRSDIEYEDPRDIVEKKLVETWQQVLGRDIVGIHEDFFMIGGDSIKSIQVASRMNKDGYRVDIRDIFRSPTIARLAPLVKKTQRIPVQSPVTGRIPLTPVQERFFKLYTIDTHHFNQAVLLYSEERLEHAAVRAIFQALQQHHDALRTTYRKKDSQVIQTGHGTDYSLSMDTFDLRGREDVRQIMGEKINQIQRGIRLEEGPLMKIGVFHLNDGDRLLIVVHHLVIDGVSWRILFEDIETLYQQYKTGKLFDLPLKTDSFKVWAEKLQEYANRETFLEEKHYWKQLENLRIPEVKRDFDGTNHLIDVARLSFTLDLNQTNRLLNDVHHAFAVEINHILLTALALSIKKTFHIHQVLIALEGHGREEILPELDITRTVGWFTSIYPVLLEAAFSNDLVRQVKEIKERLNRIPGKGIGYGILKYLTHEVYKKEIRFKQKPRISFNYLGQFDTDVNHMSFSIAVEPVGEGRSRKGERIYELDITGMIIRKQLQMTVVYNRKQYKTETMKIFLENYKGELNRLIDYCAARREYEPTPCDLTYRELSIPEVDRLNRKYSLTDIYPLTPLQEGMLFHSLYNKQSYAYFEQFVYRLSGRLDISLVEKSINRLFERYEILRTAFVYEGLPRPLQIVLRERKVDFYYEDVSDTAPVEERERYIRECKEKDRRRSFNLSNGVLMRVAVLKTDMEEYEFIWSFHHILMDGWCIGILNNEFLQAYNCYLANREWRPPEVKPYRKYIQWLEEQDKKAPAEFWKNYLADYEEVAGLPTSKTASPGEEYKLDHVAFTLEREKTHDLKRIAGSRRVTLNILIQVAWGILLAKYNSKRDVVFASVVSGRPYEIEGVESMVGLFINTIPVRIRFHPGETIDHLIRRTGEEAVECKPHHYYPLAEIQAQTRLKQHLVDHLFVFENYPIAEQIDGVTVDNKELPGIKADLSKIDIFEQTNYDLGVVVSAREQLTVRLDFNANVYEKQMLQRAAGHLNRLLEEMINHPHQVITQVTILSEDEKHQVLNEFNDTQSDYPADKTIHELFEKQVQQTSDSVSLIGGRKYEVSRARVFPAGQKEKTGETMHLTYRELNKRSKHLAHHLRQKGVQPDIIVGIKMERCVEMIIGILGILKAGGAYLPIDPQYPQQRIDFMLKDSGAKVLLTDLPEGRDFHHSSLFIHHSGNLAYVIYTSGTTGKPKGVMTCHYNVTRVVKNTNYIDIKPEDRLLQLSNYAFDGSVFDIYGALLNGSALVLVKKGDVLAVGRLAEMIKREAITVFFLTTALFNTLVDIGIGCFANVRKVLFGGERVSVEHCIRALEYLGKNRIIHVYGPTETTVYTTYYFIDEIPGNAGTIPIGKPISNTIVYILDENMNPVPIGVKGEVYAVGNGTARGYSNRPELTAERFLHLTFKTKHLTLYQTGDLARWLPDGNIEFMGRMDDQVKIRGFRVELGEIETRLQEIPGIKKACVMDRQKRSGEKYLCAYFVSEKPLDPTEVRNILGKHLPDYMIPAHFIPIEEIPLTPNGKIDKRALLALEFTPAADYIAPKNKTEKIIAGIWREVLELEKVGANDHFFEAGGTSLDVIKVSTRLKEALNREIPVVHIFQYPTVSALAGYFDREETGSSFDGDDRGKAVARGKEKRKKRSQKKRGKK